MPSGDRTGPKGEGPLTGRGFGYGGGYTEPGDQNDEGRPYDGRGGGRGNRPVKDRSRTSGGTIERKVTGPGGHIPDGTGPKGWGAGPGEGMGLDWRKNIDSLYDRYPNNEAEVDNYVAEAQRQATRQNLYGDERITFIMDYVESRIRSEVPKASGEENKTAKSKGDSTGESSEKSDSEGS